MEREGCIVGMNNEAQKVKVGDIFTCFDDNPKSRRAALLYYLKKRIVQSATADYGWFRRMFVQKVSHYDWYDGFNVLDEDWDMLIILDACRYDAFEMMVPHLPFEGAFEKKLSRSSNTPKFLKRNFENRSCGDILYITANPWVGRLPFYDSNKKFFDVVNVWKKQWNKKYGTCMAKSVNKEVIKYRERYPDIQMIVHYIQPHHPFVGKTKLYWGSEKVERIGEDDVWNHPEIRRAWIDNLLYVLKYAIPIVNRYDEKIVITADHGDSFRFGGHPPDLPAKELVEVPWYVIDKRTKRKELRKRIKRVKKSVRG